MMLSYKHTLRISVLALLPLVFVACSDPEDPASKPSVQFPSNIAAVFSENCVSCHTNDNVGTFSLVPSENGYANAVANAEAIKETVSAETMPPFLAKSSAQCGSTFHNEFPMSPINIFAVTDWVNQGTPAGPADAPSLQLPTLPRLDRGQGNIVTLEMKEEYKPSGSFETDIERGRCFVIDGLPSVEGVDASKVLTGFEVTPGNPGLVHHVQLYVTNSLDANAAAQGWADQPAVGYDCYGDIKLGEANASLIANWTPGTGASYYPDNTGILIPNDRLFIMKVHYLNKKGAAPGSDKTKIDLQLADVGTVTEANILAITKTDKSINPINFSAGIAREVTYTTNHKFNRINSVTLHAILPHMHDLGASIQVKHGGNCLIDIPNWNFEWQRFFFFDKQTPPITISQDDDISIDCTYNIPASTTAVVDGYDEGQEHCLAYLYVVQN